MSAGLVLALAACGKSGPAGGSGQAAAGGNDMTATASASAGAAPSSAPASGVQTASLHVQPGEWEVTEETLDASGTGPAAAYLQRMKGHKRTSQECITPEEAGKPIIFSQSHDNECDYSHMNFGSGTIKGSITCNDPHHHGSVTMTMDGHYSAQSYEMTSSVQMSMQGASTKIDAHRVAHRIGDCPAGGEDPE
ncbi:MAG TPA: DUF3617 domain-containing protein [Allosphingosinicella sp.]|nr:DUF3617 domain-containing protein [Allosphingosinicella sp.]